MEPVTAPRGRGHPHPHTPSHTRSRHLQQRARTLRLEPGHGPAATSPPRSRVPSLSPPPTHGKQPRGPSPRSFPAWEMPGAGKPREGPPAPPKLPAFLLPRKNEREDFFLSSIFCFRTRVQAAGPAPARRYRQRQRCGQRSFAAVTDTGEMSLPRGKHAVVAASRNKRCHGTQRGGVGVEVGGWGG